MPITIAPPAGGYTSQFLLDTCRAAAGGTVILDREAARSYLKSMRSQRAKLPRVGESTSVYPAVARGAPPALVLESRAGGVIHCRADWPPLAPPAAPGWELVRASMWVRDDGATASIYGSDPWTSEAERARWVLESRGWTVRNPHTGEVGAMRQPWPTRAEAEAAAASMPLPSRIGIGD